MSASKNTSSQVITVKSESKHFSRRLYLIDTAFQPVNPSDKDGNSHSLEEYASELTYRILSDLMDENQENSKAWYFDILRDKTPESLQLAYRLMGRTTRKGSLNIMPGVPQELNEWYNTNKKANDTLAILADADTLNTMGYQMMCWIQTKYDIGSDEVMVDENHNFFFKTSSGKIEEIPKFSANNEQATRYRDLASKISYNKH